MPPGEGPPVLIGAPKARSCIPISTGDTVHLAHPVRVHSETAKVHALRAKAWGQHLNCSGRCLRPVAVIVDSLRERDILPAKGGRSVDITAPCRKCEECFLVCRRQWMARAAAETEAAHRTWFITPTTRWGEIHDPQEARKWLSAAFQRALKRLRKATAPKGVKIRFWAVQELHKSGMPHWHALLHQIGPTPLLKVDIEEAFAPVGFTRPRLVKDGRKAIFYIAKYMTKSASEETRVRASLNYGEASQHKDAQDMLACPQRVVSDPAGSDHSSPPGGP